jgi:hypothetical protein
MVEDLELGCLILELGGGATNLAKGFGILARALGLEGDEERDEKDENEGISLLLSSFERVRGE